MRKFKTKKTKKDLESLQQALLEEKIMEIKKRLLFRCNSKFN